MPQFRKRPVVIEAVQWFKMGDHPEVREVFQADEGGSILASGDAGSHDGIIGYHRAPAIYTSEGWFVVTSGDWIIRGVKGELYPCKPDIFAMTYQPADEGTLLPAVTLGDVLLEIRRKVLPVTEAARAFVDRLQEVESDARWKQVWTMAHIHGLPYTGPFFADEAEALRKALDEAGV
jgi:hypothetical protein